MTPGSAKEISARSSIQRNKEPLGLWPTSDGSLHTMGNLIGRHNTSTKILLFRNPITLGHNEGLSLTLTSEVQIALGNRNKSNDYC